MVILGGLEVVAAGYLIHKHKQNKRERALLREEAEALEEETYQLQLEPPYHKPHRHSHSHSRERQETDEERKERRRRRERREREKYDDERRDHSAPPRIPVPVQRQPVRQTQTSQPGGIVTGWPAHWQQSQTPPSPPPGVQVQPPPAPIGPNGYAQDVKYGFVPEIPHDQYPPYPPPPFSPGRRPVDDTGRANTLDVNDGRRGRPKTRRSLSPRMGVYDEYERSPTPRVRFSTEDEVLGEERRKRGGRNSPPPRYRP